MHVLPWLSRGPLVPMNLAYLRARYDQCTYCRYFIIGGIVGCLAVLAREVIAALLPADTPAYYMLSVVIVYAGGILASYCGHRKFSFRSVPGSLKTVRSLGTFAAVAILGMFTTVLLSALFRYGMPIEMGIYQPSLAFALAAVATSFFTYWMNKIFTFKVAARTYAAGRNDDGGVKWPVIDR